MIATLACVGAACGPGQGSAGVDAVVPSDGAVDARLDAAGPDAALSDAAGLDAAPSDAAPPDATVPTACSLFPCPPGAHCFEENGLVHAPTPALPVRRLTYAIPNGTYTRFRLEMDVYHGGWATPSEAIRHNLFWLARDGRNFDMIGYANFEKPSTVHLVHGFGMVHGDKVKLRVSAPLTELQTYHISYTYDPGGQTLSLVVSHQGTVISTQTDTPNVTSIAFDNHTIDMDMGFVDGLNPAEPATYGWEYRDVCLQVIP